jgi:hypothetical protein
MQHLGKLVLRVVFSALGGVPLLLLSFTLLSVWIDPQSIDNGGWVRIATNLVLIEFILLHSGAFMAVGPVIFDKFWYRLAWFAGFFSVYAVSLFGIAWWSQGHYVFWMLLGVLISRLMILVVLPDKKGTIMMLQRSAVGMVILILTCFILLLPLPQLGLTEEVRWATFGPVVDALTEYPQRMIAWGLAYFFLMALVEFIVGWNFPDWSDEEADRAWEVLKKK